jgi:hypothetical protein
MRLRRRQRIRIGMSVASILAVLSVLIVQIVTETP